MLYFNSFPLIMNLNKQEILTFLKLKPTDIKRHSTLQPPQCETCWAVRCFLCFISVDAPPEACFSSLLVLAYRGAEVTAENEPSTVGGVKDPTGDKASVHHSALLPLIFLLFTICLSVLCVLFQFPFCL